MPGAFAHITAVNIATQTKSLAKMDMPKKAKLILLNSSPIEDLMNIVDLDKVINNGLVLDPKNLISNQSSK